MSEPDEAAPAAPVDTIAVPKRQYYGLMVLLAIMLGAIAYNYHQMTTNLVLPDTPRARQVLATILHKEEADKEAADHAARDRIVVPAKVDLHSGQELLDLIRKGGYVLYFRHFQTDHSKWHEDPIKPQHGELPLEAFFDCSKQRPLSEWGRERATHVGEIMRKYQVPIGKIRASPYCRVTEGLKLLFHRDPDEVHKELIYRGGKYTYELMATNLLPFLGRKPEPGTNDVVMAHRPQMDDIGKITEGEMWIFEPLGDKQFNLVGMIKDSEWFESLVAMDLLGAAGHRGGSYR